jgi:hypothetical protein
MRRSNRALLAGAAGAAAREAGPGSTAAAAAASAASGTLRLLTIARDVAGRLRLSRMAGGRGAGAHGRRPEGMWRLPLLWAAVVEYGMGDAVRPVRVVALQVL